MEMCDMITLHLHEIMPAGYSWSHENVEERGTWEPEP